MSEVQKRHHRRFRPEELGERDWMPTSCIKMSSLYKMWLRQFLMYLVKTRLDAGDDHITIELDEWDFSTLVEIIAHFDNARLIKSSVDPLTRYGTSRKRPLGPTV